MSVPFNKGYPGINDKREEKQVRQILDNDENQRNVLNKILTNF